MKVYKVIIHELHKARGSDGAKLRKSKTLSDPALENVEKLIIELNTRYRKRNEKAGIFDEAYPTVFHDTFSMFYNDHLNEEEFISFSHKSAENLRERIEGIGSAKGGYLIYAHYVDYRPYCAVFFVRNTAGIAFKRNSTVESFDVDRVEHIDFEKLAMACRINMELFKVDNSKYLSFVHNKNDNISKYFIKWISSTDTVTSEQETNLLYKVLKSVPLPEKTESGVSLTRDYVIGLAYKIIHNDPNRTARLRELSTSIFEDENYLVDYAYEHYPELPNEFKTHTSGLRRFKKIYTKTTDIELNFTASAFQDRSVRFDENDANQLIIYSPELVRQVREAVDY